MIRQTPIPKAMPGEPISRALMDQLIAGANTGRIISGDGVDVTSIGGVIGVSNPTVPNPNVNVFVLVKGGGGSLSGIGGLYDGVIFHQNAFTVSTSTSNSVTSAPTPWPGGVVDCVVVNVGEFGAATHTIASDTPLPGIWMGYADNLKPMIFVQPNASSSIPGTAFTVWVQKDGGSNGTTNTFASYTYSAFTESTMTTAIATGISLVPGSGSAARIVPGPVTFASNGNMALLSIIANGSGSTYILWNVPETHGNGTC